MKRWVLAGLLAIAATPVAAQTRVSVASNATGSGASVLTSVPGQSFTVLGPDDKTAIVFSFQDISGGNVGSGNLYLFTSAYAGTPGQLSSSGALASASFQNGAYTFAPTVRLTAGSIYYAYADTAFSVAQGGPSPYTGGSLYLASNPIIDPRTVAFMERANNDFRFNVTGIVAVAAAPEPAAWGLMIFGFGAVGGVLRRKRTTSRPPAIV